MICNMRKQDDNDLRIRQFLPRSRTGMEAKKILRTEVLKTWKLEKFQELCKNLEILGIRKRKGFNEEDGSYLYVYYNLGVNS